MASINKTFQAARRAVKKMEGRRCQFKCHGKTSGKR
jgi:hypothetical protein